MQGEIRSYRFVPGQLSIDKRDLSLGVPKVLMTFVTTTAPIRSVEQNVYWSLLRHQHGKVSLTERDIRKLCEPMIGQTIELKRDGAGDLYVSQDSLDELVLSLR